VGVAAEGYPRLSPGIFPCQAGCAGKKTFTLLIPALSPVFPGVIPEVILTQKELWKSRWETGELPPKKPLSNLNRIKVIHEDQQIILKWSATAVFLGEK
jgi:hypothetical protein